MPRAYPNQLNPAIKNVAEHRPYAAFYGVLDSRYVVSAIHLREESTNDTEEHDHRNCGRHYRE